LVYQWLLCWSFTLQWRHWTACKNSV